VKKEVFMSDASEELLRLTQQLLDGIAAGDWAAYRELCDPALTAFEPEAAGHLVEGLAFHEFYFRLDRQRGPVQSTMCAPKVRLAGDVGVVTYVRLTQRVDPGGEAVTTAAEETRVWQRQGGTWKLIHFHRSANR
jgi:ketosteroid isomerase-like protein